MIKRIVFDLDNTLIEWKDEYIFALANVLNKLGIYNSNDMIKKIDSKLVDYENHNRMYNKRTFVEFINTNLNINLPYEFADMLIVEQGKCYDRVSDEVLNTLEYLSNKYDLVVLSNWFSETQKKRLTGCGIIKYFTFVSGGDERPLKPALSAFDILFDKYKKEECVMIGDSLKNDILPALKIGMNAILLTDKKIQDTKLKTIKKLSDLKNIL